MMSFNECAESVFVKNYPDYFPAMYDEMAADGSIDSTDIVSEDYIRSTNEKYNLFEHTLELVVESGKAIAQNKPLLRYVNLMARALYDRKTYRSKTGITLPWPAERDIAFDFAAMIALLPSMEHPDRIIRERKMSEEIRKRTFTCFEGCIDIHVNRFGWAALNQ
nr:hypothetical protein [Clostridia bacterium]